MSDVFQFANAVCQETAVSICSFIEDFITNQSKEPCTNELLNCYLIGSEELGQMNPPWMKHLTSQCYRICREYFLKIKCSHTDVTISPIQFRKVFGPTHLHADGVKPIVDRSNTNIYHRIGTVVIILNKNNDVLHFPDQGLQVPMTCRSAITFPPYRMFTHFTNYGGIPRYSLQFWILSSSPILIEDVLHLKSE